MVTVTEVHEIECSLMDVTALSLTYHTLSWLCVYDHVNQAMCDMNMKMGLSFSPCLVMVFFSIWNYCFSKSLSKMYPICHFEGL